jgi:tetratricopeptide (TPR) repeat protein
MKKIFFLFLISFTINYSDAQTGNPDSIKQLLHKDKGDSSRVLHLADLSYEYIASQPDTMMTLALQALEISRRIGFLKGEAESLNSVGNAYGAYGNYPKEMEAYLLALQINEKINNLHGKQRNLGNIGTIYEVQEDYRQALDYYFAAKRLGEQLNDKRRTSIDCINIASSYLSLKIFDSARLYAQQAYDMANSINYPRLIGSTLNTLGVIHFELGQNNSALEHYRLSIPYSIKARNYSRLSSTYLDMATLFEKVMQKDSAIFYAKQSLLMAKERGLTRETRDAGRFLTSYYRSINRADSAFFYLDLTKIANDSLFSMQKQRQLQSLAFDEKLRQQEIAAAAFKANEERTHNLQYAAIALGLVTFIILFFLLSHSIIANQKVISFLGILALLIVFEFLNLLLHPFLDRITHHQPIWMLVAMVCIAALLIPMHHKLEHWITHKMVEKNNKIRLAAAKKTIVTLERNVSAANS